MGVSKRLRSLPEPLTINEKAHLQADVASEDEIQEVSPRSKHRRTAAELKVSTASLIAAKESFRKCNLALQSARKTLDDAVAAEAHSGAVATKIVETQTSVMKVPERTSSDANKRLCQEHFLALNSDGCTNPGPHIGAILQAYEEATGINLEDESCKSFATAARKRPPLRNAHDSAVINRVQTFFDARHAALGGMPRMRRRNMLASVQAVLGAPRPTCAGAGAGVAPQNDMSSVEAAFEEARRNQQASAARLRSEELDQRQAEADEQDAAEEVAANCGFLHPRSSKPDTMNQVQLGAKLQGRVGSVRNASVLEDRCGIVEQGVVERPVEVCTSSNPLEID